MPPLQRVKQNWDVDLPNILSAPNVHFPSRVRTSRHSMGQGGFVIGAGVSGGQFDPYTANTGLMMQLGQSVVRKVNRPDDPSAFSPETAVARAASCDYQFSSAQISALIPVYRWFYHANGVPLVSTSNSLHAHYGWSLEGCCGYAYGTAQKDSVPILLSQDTNGHYTYTAVAPDRVVNGCYQPPSLFGHKGRPNRARVRVYFWAPTKGPFSIVNVAGSQDHGLGFGRLQLFA